MFTESLKHALMITSFVMVMMLLIEFINVQSKGNWSSKLGNSPFWQVLFSALLGLIPGCLGAYAVVSLYTHNVINFGALMAAMIATTGDETFIMFSVIPKQAILISGIVFVLAVLTGLLINLFYKNKTIGVSPKNDFHVHSSQEGCVSIKWSTLMRNYKTISIYRSVLIMGLLIFIVGLIIGEFGHVHGQVDIHAHEHAGHAHDENGHWNWVEITFMLVSAVALFLVSFSTDHFVKEHIWNHIIKVHFLKIFMWTFGALLAIHLLADHIAIEEWIKSNYFMVMLIAIAIGLLPVSGPHIVFITLFFYGTIPFSVLLVNSIVQEGHGALPLFAESKWGFVVMKGIKVVIALVVGGVGYFLI